MILELIIFGVARRLRLQHSLKMIPLAEDINVEGGTIVARYCHYNQHQNNMKVFAVRKRNMHA